MKKYKLQWNYTSSLGGPWEKGEVVELDEEMAERVNVDSPGVLKATTAKKRTPAKNRQKTESKKRSVVEKVKEKIPKDVMSPDKPGYGKELVKDK